MEGDRNTNTILQRKRKYLKVNKEEILLMLRCYHAHPTNLGHIIDEMKQNLNHLPDPVKELYTTSAGKQLRDRLSSKFGKLMREKRIQDDDIRTEVEAIVCSEKRLVQTTTSQPHAPSSSASGSDIREVALEDFSDSDEEPTNARRRQTGTAKQSPQRAIPSTSGLEQGNAVPAVKPAQKMSRKRPLMDLVRENQLQYNRFITKKIPKLLRQLGVSSGESD